MRQLWRDGTLRLRVHGASTVLEGGCSSKVPVQRNRQRLTGKKVNRVYDSLHDELDRNVSDSAEQISFSEHDQINF